MFHVFVFLKNIFCRIKPELPFDLWVNNILLNLLLLFQIIIEYFKQTYKQTKNVQGRNYPFI